MNNIDKYTFRVVWSEADQEFVGLCDQFPSMSWLEPTEEAAREGIERVVQDILNDPDYLQQRGVGADLAMFDRFMSREGGDAPRCGDEI